MKKDLKYAAIIICSLIGCLALYKNWEFKKTEDLENDEFHDFRPYPYSKSVEIQRSNETAKIPIAIVIMVKDSFNDENYRIAVNSIRCYAEVQEYAYIYVDYSKNQTLQKMCPQEDFLFARHCIMVDLMKREPYDWFLFFGADNGVINPIRRIEEYIPEEPTVNVMFYNRFYNDEIMADSYLIRNTQQSYDFLNLWVEYYNITKDYECSGTDNGAIQAVVLEFFAPELNRWNTYCQKMWWMGRKYADLFLYEACQGWSRDGWVTGTRWCERDLFFHGWKKEKLNTEWKLPFIADDFFDKTCTPGEFTSYNSHYKADCLDVDLEMHVFFEEARRKYYKALRKLRKLGNVPHQNL
ncbi:unnamed protein product, partial [Mesorhabditis spiculigera]